MQYITKKITENKRWPQYLVAIIGSLLSFSIGIHFGWPTPFLPKLLSGENSINVTNEDASYVTSTALIGDVIAYAICTFLPDWIGRKMTLLLVAPCYIVSFITIYFSFHSIALLYVGRIVGGIAEGGSIALIPVYFAEISEPNIRGILFSYSTTIWCVGSLFINTLGSYSTIQISSLISLTFPLIFLVIFPFMPETPHYFLSKNNLEDARISLKKVRWNEDVEEELMQLQKEVDKEMLEKGRYQDLILDKAHRKAFIIGTFVPLVEVFSGMSCLTYYAQIFFSDATDVISEQWASSLMIILKLVFLLVSNSLVDMVGRKPLLLFSIGGSFITLTFLTIFFLVRDYTNVEVDQVNWIPLMGMILFTAVYNIGLGNIPLWLMGELLSTSVRAKGIGVANIIYCLVTFGMVTLYQTLADNYSSGIPLLMFSVLQVFGFIFCWKCVPETKGRTLEDIQKELAS